MLGTFLLLMTLMQPSQEPWKAPIVPDAPVIKLDEIGLYRVGYTYRGRQPVEMPFGWSGHFDDDTGISCQPFGEQDGKSAFLLHCPWRNGTGTTFQEFLIALPQAGRISLTGFVAMKSDFARQSDGVVYRVLVDGSKRFEMHKKDAAWTPFRVDLTALAGKPIRLRFEADCGPDDDPSFDYSLWGDRTLTFTGYRPTRKTRPPRPPLDLARLRRPAPDDPAPSVGYSGTSTVTIRDGAAVLRYAGEDGTFEYRWQPEASGLGRLTLAVTRAGTRTVVPLGSGSKILWTGSAEERFGDLKLVSGNTAARATKRVHVGSETATLTLECRLVGKSLALTVECDRPLISRLDAGDWGPVLRRRQVPVPYYGSVQYLASEGLFADRFLDWTVSQASSYSGGTAYYGKLAGGSRNTLRERVLFTAAWHLAEVLPNIPNPPSPYLREVGGMVVLDVWGGRYTDIARKLEALHEYGIRRCIVLIHDWQRSGYDNALPMHIPAEAGKGGDDGMKDLVSTAVRLGYRIALHENYVDYYPNYDHFDERHIALDSDGKRVLAWYNPGTKIQSFAVQPNAILELAATQSPEIHARYGTNACYLDVHSAVPPWFHVDFRAGEQGAGTFRRVFEAHRDLWAYERATHGGPVFGEGNCHWYWSGLLDGVEAQFGTGWPAGRGQSAPLMVDFNLLKVHPLQINHGQGYYERWWSNLPWGAVPPLAILDQYRMQEALYGHIGFLGSSTWDKIPYAWLEHHLLTPVTSRHAGVAVRSIEYFVDGRWVAPSTAAEKGDWRRPKVVFANGLQLIGNASSESWRVHGATLAPNGWLAHGAGVTAYTAVRDGVVVDYAETDDTVFANARPLSDWQLSPVLAVRPEVQEFAQTGPRQFRATYRWNVGETPGKDYHCFVHFSAANRGMFDEDIRFQQDHAPPSPTSTWQAGSTIADGPYTISIPDDVPDGEYEWSIGLFLPTEGRALLDGASDQSGRIVLGILVVRDQGRHVEFRPSDRPIRNLGQLKLEALNRDERVVTFGTVRTNGSVHVERLHGEWILRTMPRNRDFIVMLRADRFGRPTTVTSKGGATQTVTPQDDGPWWILPLNGATEYRWPVKSE